MIGQEEEKVLDEKERGKAEALGLEILQVLKGLIDGNMVV